MSPKKKLLTVGLTALGWFGTSATRAADPGVSPASPGLSRAPASSNATQKVLLKNNGQILQGEISQAGKHYLVQQAPGTIKVDTSDVEGTFESVAAVYLYKLARVPARDPDEHMKLARWCMSQNMATEARTELLAVVALSPTSREAKAMLASVESAAARVKRPRVDSGLVRTRGEVVESVEGQGDPRPAEIDATVVRSARRELGVSSLPVIFDLPPAVAVKRADVFARTVNPVLITACARCHNEQYPGTFQLIQVKSRKAPTAVALRSNLDATLRLIDPDSPARSELLTRALVPHGAGTTQRPIFKGPNDVGYKILDAWVKSLHDRRPSDASNLAQDAPKDPSAGQSFAVDRLPGQTASTLVSPNPNLGPKFEPPPAGAVKNVTLPPTQYVPGEGLVKESSAPEPGDFPVPPMLGGPLPASARPAAKVDDASPTAPGSALPPLPGTVPATAAQPKARPKVKLNLDPEVLQQAILNRNIGR